MNTEKLLQSEKNFLRRYPGGFDHPELQQLIKKHHPGKMMRMTEERFGSDSFADSEAIIGSMVKVISASSMVSVFEKSRFRDFAATMDADRKQVLSRGLFELLHENQETGFDMMTDILGEGKLAKWTLLTVIPVYYYPDKEVFVKPTTAKGIIKYFELEKLEYKPLPSYSFYTEFRKNILAMKDLVSGSLSPGNAAFTGFLMMCMEGLG